MRVLATSGAGRSGYLPEVPSFAEAGHPALVIKEWFACFAAGRAARDAVAGWATALAEAIARPEVATAWAQAGMTAVSRSPAELAARIAAERRDWQPVLRALDLLVE